MDNAQLIGLSRQIALQRQMDVVANNMANLNTTGFRAQAMLFEDYLDPTGRDMGFLPSDQPLTFTQDWTTMHDMTAGAMTPTGNPLDVALQGDGFLVVETPGGERYTKAGALQIDAGGQLVDLNGNPVMSEAGPVRFSPAETEIEISPTGLITASGASKGRLRLVEFDAPQALTREGSTYFAGADPLPATQTRVLQGFVERSNVSGVTEMTRMIRVQRAYQSISSMLQRHDELKADAVKRLGNVSA